MRWRWFKMGQQHRLPLLISAVACPCPTLSDPVLFADYFLGLGARQQHQQPGRRARAVCRGGAAGEGGAAALCEGDHGRRQESLPGVYGHPSILTGSGSGVGVAAGVVSILLSFLARASRVCGAVVSPILPQPRCLALRWQRGGCFACSHLPLLPGPDVVLCPRCPGHPRGVSGAAATLHGEVRDAELAGVGQGGCRLGQQQGSSWPLWGWDVAPLVLRLVVGSWGALNTFSGETSDTTTTTTLPL